MTAKEAADAMTAAVFDELHPNGTTVIVEHPYHGRIAAWNRDEFRQFAELALTVDEPATVDVGTDWWNDLDPSEMPRW